MLNFTCCRKIEIRGVSCFIYQQLNISNKMETKFVEIEATLEKLRYLQTQQKHDFEDCIALDDYEIKCYKEKLKNIEMENAALRDRLHAVLMAASGLTKPSKN
jgi:hypothetical protein